MQKNRNKQGVPPAHFLRQVMALMLIMLLGGSAWAQQYVFISNETNGYFIGLSNGNAVATQTFATGSCVWTASGTLNNNNRTLRINTSYLDGAASNSGTVSIGSNRNGYWRGNNNQLYYYRNANRAVYRDGTQVKWNGATNLFRIYTSYSTTDESFTVANITGINDLVTAKGTYNLVSAASYNPTYYTFTGPDTRYWASGYTTGAVTTRPVKTTGFTSDTWSLNKTIPGLSINSNTGVLTYNTYVTEDTQVTITHTVRENGQTKTATRTITLKGTIETSLSFASTSLNMTATTLRLPAVNLTASNGSTPPGSVTYSSNNTGCISVSNTGVLTINGAGTATITANYAANGAYLASSATMTITVANTAAFDETVFGEIAITPSSQTLDLDQQVTYTASESLNSTHRTRPAYSTISTGGNNYYKVGANYQAAVPDTNVDNAPIRFTSFIWSAAEGGAYFTLDPYYSSSSNQVTLTRSAQKTGTQQTFTISVTGRYGGWSGPEKTATATVTIPLTQVDITNLYPGEALALGMGEVGSVVGHYSWQPNDPSAGKTYTNFKYTSNSTSIATVDASGNVTAVGPGSTTITVTAVKLDGTDGVTCNVTVNVTIDAPTISIDGSGNVTITHPVPGVQIRYTTNGVDPTATTGTVYSGTFAASNEQTIKAIAVANGVASAVASEFYATSGVNGSKVILNDYEDHNWTYYAGVDSEVDGGNYNTSYKGKLYSPNPRNVKITYLGNGKLADLTTSVTGVKVGVDANANTFVYYKTIEDNDGYKYTTIPNPFSVRPKINSNYYGFVSWRVKSVNGGTITGQAVGSTINAETEITFVPTRAYTLNCTSMEVELEAVWDVAEVSTDGTFSNGYNSVERNFYVVSSSSNNNLPVVGTRCTYSSFYPNGTTNGSNAATMADRGTRRGNFTCTADSKVEYIILSYASGTINADAHNLTIGRGCSPASGVSANLLCGMTGKTVTNPQFHLRVESGVYDYMSYLGGYYSVPAASTGNPSTITGDQTHVIVTMGSDYDRAVANGNNNLQITYAMMMGTSANQTNTTNTAFRTRTNRDNPHTLDLTIKSGKLGTSLFMETATGNTTYLQGGAGYGHYFSMAAGQTNVGRRNILMEGGETCTLGSGIDVKNNSATGGDANNTTTNRGCLSYNLRIKGGIVHGNVYGGAAQSPSGGNRVMVVTGGQVKGWFAAGCNGTSNDGGQNYGTSWVYIGGNGRIDSEGSTKTLGYAGGGNVYAAGAGRSGSTTCGEMTFGSNLVIADNSYIERGAYGGGNYGYTLASSNIYITGGTNAGNNDGVTGSKGGVYGGANQQNGPEIKIWMTGGKMLGGVYGGSNTSGTISGNVTMQVNGGQVGQDAEHTANIHGGGYGNSTIVSRNVDITLGKTDAARDADGVTVWGDVYGGSALGKVNGEAATNTYHTNVTMNAGYIHGSLYGGALGQKNGVNGATSDIAANVYGPVQVKVYGGSVFNTDGTGANGSGAVYGANNINGAPQRSVTVDIYGTNSAPAEGEYALFSVYGGGNAADYTYGNGYPKVTVHNCDNSIEYVYGGGNAAAVAATDVTIYGGNKIGNVFGGGNGQVTPANVNGNTNVKIYGGTIGDVYGGSNTKGDIGGTISVNVNAQAEPSKTACPINIDNVYGGGNKAPSAAGNITIGCAEHIGAVYGGANQANITGNINLNIVSGHIDNVLGGNNTSGNISGTITVTVNDTNFACGMEVGNVYGGGNKAAYGTGTNYPVVNIKNGHLTGSVFGGGLGETAVVTGNPQVTIGQPSTGIVHIDGNVFGGGDAANVVGKPTVLVRNCNTMIGTKNGAGEWNTTGGTVYGGGNAADITGGTTVTIIGGSINRVFGGGNGEVDSANVTGNASTFIHGGLIHQAFAGSNTQGSIGGTASITVDHDSTACGELIDELYGGGNLAAGNAGSVTIECGAIVGDVYGGANQAAVNSDITLNITGGTIARAFGGNNTSGAISGVITVNVNKDPSCDLSLGSVFGAGNQAPYTGNPVVNIKNGTVTNNVYGGGLGASAVVTGNPQVTIGDSSNLAWVAIVGGDVYGGGDAAAVVGTPVVHVIANPNTTIANVYGGGNAADVSGTNVTIDGGQITGMVFGGGHGDKTSEPQKEANVNGDVTLNVTGGTINKVFAGSNSKGNITGNVNFTINKGNTSNPMHINEVYGGGNEAAGNAGTINIICTGGADEGIGDVYGGANAADINSDITLNITGGKIANVFGGNNTSGDINGGIAVNVDWNGGCAQNSLGNVYGGGNLAQYTIPDGESLAVNIKNGTVTNNVYGGGKGDANDHTKGQVTGNPVVTVGVADNDKRAIVNGDVYGGGDAGNVVGTPVVNVINKCNTQIANVYGGGNAADVSGTDVNIDGGNITGMVFGGGHGDRTSEPQKEANVAGDVHVDVTGGTINKVFGGSNSKGNIAGQIALNINKGNSSCDMHIAEVYGGGNEAAGNAGTITIGCTGGEDEGIGDVYGGANAAAINSDIALNITGGKIGRVFGGNNTSGAISGGISVTVDWAGSCGTNSLGSVFGAGNQAAYSGSPVVYIKNGTISNNVFGGGLGASAVVTGNPQVTVGNATAGNSDSVHIIGNVFGGGDAAGVAGSPSVTVNNCNTLVGTKDGEGAWIEANGTVYGGGNAAHVTGGEHNNTNVTINGGDIYRVFGGGNGEVSEANVAGDANTTIHGGNIHQAFAGSNTQGAISGTARISIDHTSSCPEKIDELYGGGNLAAGGAGEVNIGCDAVLDDVYGGANQADVNGDITLNITGGTIGRAFGGNNKSGVINGAIEVNVIHDGSCALSLGYVYGAGNQAAYTTPGGKVGPTVNIKHGTVDHNVFGGGLGASAVVTGNPVVTIGDNTNPSYNAIVGGEVYGGGDAAPTVGNPTVNMGKGNVKTIYGGGKGADALVTGNPTVNVSGTADIDFYVFGGGDAARTAGSPTVNITGGVVGNRIGGLSTPSPAGSIYGGGKGSSANVDGNPVVNISNVADVKYNVFGGGSEAPTNGNTSVIMTSGTVEKNIFGGGEGATATTRNTTVKVSGASTKVGENVYGGGLGAEVNGETNVLIGADE